MVRKTLFRTVSIEVRTMATGESDCTLTEGRPR